MPGLGLTLPRMASNFTTILSAVKDAVDTLGLMFQGVAVATVERKLPRAEESLDTLPLICVTQRGPEQVEPFDSENHVLVKYEVIVTIVAGGSHDFTTTNRDTWLTWREQIRKLFQWELSGVSSVFKVDVNPEQPLDLSKLNQNFEYSALGFRFWSVESRTN